MHKLGGLLPSAVRDAFLPLLPKSAPPPLRETHGFGNGDRQAPTSRLAGPVIAEPVEMAKQ